MTRGSPAKHATPLRVKLVIYYFAALRDVLALSEEQIELPAPALCVRDLAQYLTRLHPELAPHLGSVRFAVNETFADAATPLASGDVVALIPPVTGG
jgi:molybdopterin converting factor subunit 1